MLHPPTESPSRDARPPRRPGVVALPVAALAAILTATVVLVVAVTARGGTDDRDPRAIPSVPSAPIVVGTDTPSGRGGTEGTANGAADGTVNGTPGQRPSAQGESASPLPSPPTKRPDPPRTDRVRTTPPAAGSPTAADSRRGTSGASPRPRPTTGRPAATSAPRTAYDALRVGDCFDIDRAAPGTVARRACDTPHDAELVARLRLTGAYADDRAVRDAAAALCRAPLRAEAAQQPLGTRWATFVQYPYRTSYLLGADTVACSLAAPSDSGRKLTAPLR
ncbi:hypothetical protein ACFY7C_02020 [Streptomyces sp. NPDC012769]|uniref:hypothetical protein n=1 Tax=Streptomyces sp. NPDC012769 TaxID=3364848 RepID=UPI0036AC0050